MGQPLLRSILKDINPDHRWIKAMEQLLSSSSIDLTSVITTNRNCAEFYSTINQSGLNVSVPTAATFNVTRYSHGISLNGSRITVNKTGTYKFSFRIQL